MTETVEAPAAAQTEIKPIHHWIGGRIVPGASGRSGPVWNPATGEQSGEVNCPDPRCRPEPAVPDVAHAQPLLRDGGKERHCPAEEAAGPQEEHGDYDQVDEQHLELGIHGDRHGTEHAHDQRDIQQPCDADR